MPTTTILFFVSNPGTKSLGRVGGKRPVKSYACTSVQEVAFEPTRGPSIAATSLWVRGRSVWGSPRANQLDSRLGS